MRRIKRSKAAWAFIYSSVVGMAVPMSGCGDQSQTYQTTQMEMSETSKGNFKTSRHSERSEESQVRSFGKLQDDGYGHSDTPDYWEDEDHSSESVESGPNAFEELRNFVVADKHEAADVVIAVFGGWNSCHPGPDQTQVFERARVMFEKKRAQGLRYRIVASCFKKKSSNIYFYSTSDTSIKRGFVHHITARIQQEVAQTTKQGVYIIGHSYGGWQTMRTVLGIPAKVKIKGLATIDPISNEQCKPSVLAGSYFGSVLRYRPAPECTRAPADISDSLKRYIARRVGWWHNFYQTHSGYLHSGPVLGALKTRYR